MTNIDWLYASAALYLLLNAVFVASRQVHQNKLTGVLAVSLIALLFASFFLPLLLPQAASRTSHDLRRMAVIFAYVACMWQYNFALKKQRQEQKQNDEEFAAKADLTPMNLSVLNGRKKEPNP